MISIKSATVLCVAIVFLNLNQYDSKTVTANKDTNKATNTTITTNTTNPTLVKKFIDLNGIIHNFFPNLNNNGNPVNNLQYPGNNFNGGIYPVNPNTPQGNNYQQYPGNNFNNLNGGNYPVNPNAPQIINPQYPGNDFNNFNGGYPVNPNIPQVKNPQYPGNDFNNFNGNYPVNPNTPQGYPGNNFNNFNGGNYPVNQNIPQGNNPLYPGNGFNNFNGGYPVNPNTPQQNYPQYPGAGNNLDNNNNWSNNRYPGNYNNRPSYPNEQGLYPGPGNSWNNANGLQNNQNPNRIVFPGDKLPIQGVPQGRIPSLNQGQPQDPQGTFQSGNPGLQNGGSFNPHAPNGLNNLPNGNLPLQYPQIARPGIATTEKAAILGLPVTVSNVANTQIPPFTASTSSAMKQCVQDCSSTSEYNPLCGSNNVTYFNEGKMACARSCDIDVTAIRKGACNTGPTPGIFG